MLRNVSATGVRTMTISSGLTRGKPSGVVRKIAHVMGLPICDGLRPCRFEKAVMQRIATSLSSSVILKANPPSAVIPSFFFTLRMVLRRQIGLRRWLERQAQSARLLAVSACASGCLIAPCFHEETSVERRAGFAAPACELCACERSLPLRYQGRPRIGKSAVVPRDICYGGIGFA